jgi:DNA topoisomerase VI subunit A
MTEHDKKMGEELLKEPFIQKHPEWVKELEIMMKSGEKAEIQVLNDIFRRGFSADVLIFFLSSPPFFVGA